jgi:hypothetical protein
VLPAWPSPNSKSNPGNLASAVRFRRASADVRGSRPLRERAGKCGAHGDVQVAVLPASCPPVVYVIFVVPRWYLPGLVNSRARVTQNALLDVINESGLLYAGFYVLTALAAIVYFRRRASATHGTRSYIACVRSRRVFLVWLVVKSVKLTTNAENIALKIIGGAGIVLMLVARFVRNPPCR